MNKKVNFSPKTYIHNILYEKVELQRGNKRTSITQEAFYILEFSEYENILEKNYNVNQLKQICRYYKQKVSGNKSELINRVYNFLKFSYYITIIQKNIRSWQRRTYFKLNGLKNKKKV